MNREGFDKIRKGIAQIIMDDDCWKEIVACQEKSRAVSPPNPKDFSFIPLPRYNYRKGPIDEYIIFS